VAPGISLLLLLPLLLSQRGPSALSNETAQVRDDADVCVYLKD
jgi:hypothetical protein